MFPNWTGWKTVKALLYVAGGFVAIVPTEYRVLYSTVVAAVGSLVVVLSGTALGPTVSQ
jgi:hypothetical protein